MAVTLQLVSIETILAAHPLGVKYLISSPTIGEVPIEFRVPAQLDLTAAEKQAPKALLDWADDLHSACQLPLYVG
jgi:hypothetical protein